MTVNCFTWFLFVLCIIMGLCNMQAWYLKTTEINWGSYEIWKWVVFQICHLWGSMRFRVLGLHLWLKSKYWPYFKTFNYRIERPTPMSTQMSQYNERVLDVYQPRINHGPNVLCI